MKVVTNRCYGGFSLSIAAEKLYASKKGFDLFYYEQTKYKHREGFDEYTKADKPKENSSSLYCTFKKDHGEKWNHWPDGDEYWYSRNIERDDPILIEIVESLGDKASGQCAELSVTEIPDGTAWQIEEYDGMEHIAETHGTW